MKYKTSAQARKKARSLGLRGIHSHGSGKNKVYMPGSSMKALNNALSKKRKNGSKTNKRKMGKKSYR
jgi:hypothetical protein